MRLNDQSRGCVRSILVTIIIGTIPFYILGIIVWLVPGAERPLSTEQPGVVNTSDAGNSDDSGSSSGNPTWTPINLDEIVTLQPVTGTLTLVPVQSTSEVITPAPTIVVLTHTPSPEFVPIVPTDVPRSPTPTLTRTPTSTATFTSTVVFTATPSSTATATVPPLVPPTDTPAP